jgi:hypothetical protein
MRQHKIPFEIPKDKFAQNIYVFKGMEISKVIIKLKKMTK